MTQATTHNADPAKPTIQPTSFRRWLLAGVGVLCVAIGAVGVIVPGLPTTIFLIAASWCFVRSCPWLEDRLLRNRFFAPYMQYVDGSSALPMRARVTAIAMMWTCVTISLALLAVSDQLNLLLLISVPTLAVVGTGFILRWRRG